MADPRVRGTIIGSGPALISCRQVDTVDDFIDAMRVRVDVFVIEQGCPPGWDPGEIDKGAAHFIAVCGAAVVGAARLRVDGPGSLKIECMCVRIEHRGIGVGASLTRHLIDVAEQHGYRRLWMQAQAHARSFYEHCGFLVTSREYDLYNLGIAHVDMEYPRVRPAASGPDHEITAAGHTDEEG